MVAEEAVRLRPKDAARIIGCLDGYSDDDMQDDVLSELWNLDLVSPSGKSSVEFLAEVLEATDGLPIYSKIDVVGRIGIAMPDNATSDPRFNKINEVLARAHYYIDKELAAKNGVKSKFYPDGFTYQQDVGKTPF